ncbi:putative RNA-binding protein CG14230-like protein [Dinothrombium tinctorium]|uniref:Putative RNA-binding protein CG14230-like protein n=1 Tax=Dinothrombium tinctorium TaxID=1965070 RepID=A0A443QYJ0_9ACAR|nr:putative RNA-binding protein CG14230-like protein [Dinothrombium tinctorium]
MSSEKSHVSNAKEANESSSKELLSLEANASVSTPDCLLITKEAKRQRIAPPVEPKTEKIESCLLNKVKAFLNEAQQNEANGELDSKENACETRDDVEIEMNLLLFECDSSADDDEESDTSESEESSDSDETEKVLKMNCKRLYVGNLSQIVTESDLKDLFSKFGEVRDVEIKVKNVDEKQKTFAYVDLQIEDHSVPSLIKRLNTSKWKGNEITVQVAKESFLQRLAKEREETKASLSQCSVNEHSNSTVKIKPKLSSEQTFSSVKSQVLPDRSSNETSLSSKSIHISTVTKSKQKEDNEKRLETLRAKSEQQRKQQSLVQAALKATNLPNRKLVFEDTIASTKEAKKVETKKLTLFEDNEDNENTLFDLPSHTKLDNKKQKKLIEMQSNFAHDSRFKISEKFLEESDSEEEVAENNQIDETEKNISILEEVLGKSVRFEPKEKNKGEEVSDSFFMPRFDPLKPDSEKYERKRQKTEVQESEKTNEEHAESEPVVSKERFYEVSSKLKDIWGKQDDSTDNFTLSKALILPATEELSSHENDNIFKSSNVAKNTSKTVINNIDTTANKSIKSFAETEKFFFNDDDKRFHEDSFFRPELIQKSEKEWHIHRKAMIECLAKRRRHLKKKEKAKKEADEADKQSTNNRKRFRMKQKKSFNRSKRLQAKRK